MGVPKHNVLSTRSLKLALTTNLQTLSSNLRVGNLKSRFSTQHHTVRSRFTTLLRPPLIQWKKLCENIIVRTEALQEHGPSPIGDEPNFETASDGATKLTLVTSLDKACRARMAKFSAVAVELIFVVATSYKLWASSQVGDWDGKYDWSELEGLRSWMTTLYSC